MAKFVYKMQNILNVKLKLETQARNEFAVANQAYLEEQEKLESLVLKRVEYENRLRKCLVGNVDVKEVTNARKDVNTMKSIVRSQMMEVKKAQDNLEIKRKALNELMIDRKTHEKLKEKAFEQFKQEIKESESKEIDELVSFTYNDK